MGHFQYQNISGGNSIRTVRQGGEVLARRDFTALSHAPNNVSPRNFSIGNALWNFFNLRPGLLDKFC